MSAREYFRLRPWWQPLTDGPVDERFSEKVRKAVAWFRAGNGVDERLSEIQRQSWDDAKDRPWMNARPMFPIGGDGSDVEATIVTLLAATVMVERYPVPQNIPPFRKVNS